MIDTGVNDNESATSLARRKDLLRHEKTAAPSGAAGYIVITQY